MNSKQKKIDLDIDYELLERINKFSSLYNQKPTEFIINILKKEMNYLESNSNDGSILEQYFRSNNLHIILNKL